MNEKKVGEKEEEKKIEDRNGSDTTTRKERKLNPARLIKLSQIHWVYGSDCSWANSLCM